MSILEAGTASLHSRFRSCFQMTQPIAFRSYFRRLNSGLRRAMRQRSTSRRMTLLNSQTWRVVFFPASTRRSSATHQDGARICKHFFATTGLAPPGVEERPEAPRLTPPTGASEALVGPPSDEQDYPGANLSWRYPPCSRVPRSSRRDPGPGRWMSWPSASGRQWHCTWKTRICLNWGWRRTPTSWPPWNWKPWPDGKAEGTLGPGNRCSSVAVRIPTVLPPRQTCQTAACVPGRIIPAGQFQNHLPLADAHRVAGVVPALVARHDHVTSENSGPASSTKA